MINDTSIEILYLKTSKVNDNMLRVIKELIPVEEKEMLDPSVYKRHILGRWLIATSLKRKGMNSDTVGKIVFGAFKKPYISGIPFFNVSHSNDMVVCATASHGEIGIDIEYVRTLMWQNYKDWFSISDWNKISLAQDPCSALLKLWTLKESILKADGRGLQIQFSDVVLYEQFGVIETDTKRWYFKPVSFAGYSCHISCEFPIGEVILKEIEV